MVVARPRKGSRFDGGKAVYIGRAKLANKSESAYRKKQLSDSTTLSTGSDARKRALVAFRAAAKSVRYVARALGQRLGYKAFAFKLEALGISTTTLAQPRATSTHTHALSHTNQHAQCREDYLPSCLAGLCKVARGSEIFCESRFRCVLVLGSSGPFLAYLYLDVLTKPHLLNPTTVPQVQGSREDILSDCPRCLLSFKDASCQCVTEIDNAAEPTKTVWN